jgi:hypothetical protein
MAGNSVLAVLLTVYKYWKKAAISSPIIEKLGNHNIICLKLKRYV